MRLSRKISTHDFIVTVGACVQARREHLKIKQIDLAKILDISQSAISRIENGEIDISIRLAGQIAHALKTTLPELLEGLI